MNKLAGISSLIKTRHLNSFAEFKNLFNNTLHIVTTLETFHTLAWNNTQQNVFHHTNYCTGEHDN